MNQTNSGTYDALAPLEPPRVGTSKLTKWLVLALVVIVCAVPGLGLYWFRQHYQVLAVSSSSMEPTIRLDERVFTDMQYFRRHPPAPGEVVIFMRNDKPWIKRIAALPGDTIEGRSDVIYLNGKIVSEPYVQHSGPARFYSQNFGPITVKSGGVLRLG